MRYESCVFCSKYVGWFGLAGNLALFLMNLFVGLVSGSQALVVGAMYSLKDMTTSIFVIVGVNFGRKPLDREHPYGHGKIEFIMSLVFGLVLSLIGGSVNAAAGNRVLPTLPKNRILPRNGPSMRPVKGGAHAFACEITGVFRFTRRALRIRAIREILAGLS